MIAERWERARALFHECLELGVQERRDLLQRRCADDPSLKAEVESLLAQADRGGTFLEQPAAGAGMVEAEAADRVHWIGRRLGAYEVVALLGEGGMGTVFRGRRADGQFEQQVAIKLIRRGLEGDAARERFKAEQRILASLDHPNIARLLDGGVTEDGLPYFVMELVDGEPIDRHCERHGLSIEARLRLFGQVCAAVQYAHQRLTVHRDLKPANILVTADGEPKLLDFGVAKVLEPGAGAAALKTVVQPMTPEFASPEQLKGEAITTATDVYALGVIFYRLLTGHSPYRADTRDPYALAREVCETEPMRPSATATAAVPRLRRQLAGDLDSIVLMALRKEPDRRYASAGALAEDIARYLRQAPVSSRAGTWSYRLARAAQRNKGMFVALVAIGVSILGGTGVAIVQAERARQAAERARVVKEFVVDVFKVNSGQSSSNEKLRRLPAELLLEHGAGLIAAKFPGQPELQAELYGVVGEIYSDMGAWEQAGEYSKRQIDVMNALHASGAEMAAAQLRAAQAQAELGQVDEAFATAERVISLSMAGSDLHVKALVLQGNVLNIKGRQTEASARYEQAVSEAKERPGPSEIGARAEEARATLALKANRFDEGVAMLRAAIAEAIAAKGESSPAAIDIRLRLARLLSVLKRADEARPIREAALAALRNEGGAFAIRAALEEAESARSQFQRVQIGFADAEATIENDRSQVVARGSLVPPSSLATVDFYLGCVYGLWGDIKQADPLLTRSSARLGTAWDVPSRRFERVVFLGGLALFTGRHDVAETLLRERIVARKLLGGNTKFVSQDYVWLASNFMMQRRFDEAITILRQAPRAESIPGSVDVREYYMEPLHRTEARIELERGRPEVAMKLLPATDTDGDTRRRLSNLFEDTGFLRGEILCALGQRAEGLRRLEHAFKVRAGAEYEYHPELARAHAAAGLCALDLGNRSRAAELAELARKAFAEQPEVSPYFKRPYERLSRRLREAQARA